MRLTCVKNRASLLSSEWREASGHSERTIFGVTVGNEYTVFAMALGRAGLQVLVLGDAGRPKWLTLDLFSVIESSLPAWWHFGRQNEQGWPLTAVWGYPSAASSADHISDLEERKLQALRVFLREVDRSHVSPREQDQLSALDGVAGHGV